jgi:prepilin-type N-terminal cleavage/methylation domain-containing protein
MTGRKPTNDDRRRKERSAAGFSLVEVMVAFTILGVGLLSVAAAQVKAIHGTQSGRHLSQAGLVAQSQLDQLARSPWTAIAPTGWTAPVVVETNVVDGAGGAVEQSYSVRWRIEDVLPDETRSIDVQVAWTEPDGRDRTVAASTIRFNLEDD